MTESRSLGGTQPGGAIPSFGVAGVISFLMHMSQ